MFSIYDQPTGKMMIPSPRRVTYPPAPHQKPAFLLRCMSLGLLLVILAIAGSILVFSFLSDSPTPSRTYPFCARETLIRTGTATYVKQIDEVCKE